MTRNKSFFVLIILYLCLKYSDQFRLVNEEGPRDFSWDYLILSQHWPITMCINWKEHGSHSCAFPKNKDRWTLHGIWPTKSGTKGPDNCNSSWGFNPEEIKPIEKELDEAWINIFEGSPHYLLWSHEWNKHGTCGTTIKALNTQLKYFSKGIEWNKEYSLSEMLKSANILPSDTTGLRVEELGIAVASKTKKLPTIVCFTANGIQYLDEIRICFDKKLNIIDCESLVFKTCDLSQGIIYPATVNTPYRKTKDLSIRP